MEKISECEEMIMSVLWAEEDAPDLMTVTESANRKFEKEWKIQTVATFLKRLEQKGLIAIYKVGRYSHYQPLVHLDDYRRSIFMHMKKMLRFKSNEEMAEFIRKIEG